MFVQVLLLTAVSLVVAQVLGILVHVLVEIDFRVRLEGGGVTKLVHVSLIRAGEIGVALEDVD